MEEPTHKEVDDLKCVLGACRPVALTYNDSVGYESTADGSSHSKDTEDVAEEPSPQLIDGRVMSPLPANWHEKVKHWLQQPPAESGKLERMTRRSSNGGKLRPDRLARTSEERDMVALNQLPQRWHDKIRKVQEEAQAMNLKEGDQDDLGPNAVRCMSHGAVEDLKFFGGADDLARQSTA